MRFSRPILSILVAALAGAPLAAQTPRFGLQGALATPIGDLSDFANLGLQIGGHGRWDFGQGHGLMGRADLTFYGTRNDFNASSLGIGADYTFHPDRNPRGLYFLAGVSVQEYRLDHPERNYNDSGLGIDLGVGYDLNRNLGLQGRVTTHPFKNSTMTALNLGVTYTF